jgi:hypothetical protein
VQYAVNPIPAAVARAAMDSQPIICIRCPRMARREPRWNAGPVLPPPSQVAIRNLAGQPIVLAARSGCG